MRYSALEFHFTNLVNLLIKFAKLHAHNIQEDFGTAIINIQSTEWLIGLIYSFSTQNWGLIQNYFMFAAQKLFILL